METWNTSR